MSRHPLNEIFLNRVIKVTDFDNTSQKRETKFVYTQSPNILEVTHPNGLREKFSYDEIGNRTGEYFPTTDGTTPDKVQKTYTFDEFNREREERVEDKFGTQEKKWVNKHNAYTMDYLSKESCLYLTSKTPDDAKFSSTYTIEGDYTRYTHHHSTRRRHVKEVLQSDGQPKSLQNNLNGKPYLLEERGYNLKAELTSIKEYDEKCIHLDYDTQGRLTSETILSDGQDTYASVNRYHYNPHPLNTELTSAHYAYVKQNENSTEQAQFGSERQFDALGRVIEEKSNTGPGTTADSKTTYKYYEGENLLQTITHGDGLLSKEEISFTYDPDTKRLSTKTFMTGPLPSSQTTILEYEPGTDLVKSAIRRYPLEARAEISEYVDIAIHSKMNYNKNKVLTSTLRTFEPFISGYGPLRTLKRELEHSASSERITMETVSSQSNQIILKYQYDDFGCLSEIAIDGTNLKFIVGRNPTNLLSSISTQLGNTEKARLLLSYEHYDKIVTSQLKMNTESKALINHDFDGFGLLVKQTVAANNSPVQVSFKYNAVNQLSAGESTYSSMGNRLLKQAGSETYTYEGDRLSRIENGGNTTRLHYSQQGDACTQIDSPDGQISLSYLPGNSLQEVTANGIQKERYFYDYEDKLASIANKDDDYCDFMFDDDKILVESSANALSYYLYISGLPIAKITSENNAVTKVTVFTPDGSGTVHYEAELSTTTGKLISENSHRYTDYGQPIN